MGKILDFLFGKDPDIFNAEGKVEHKLPKSYWDAWQARFRENPHYNWRLHSGQKRGQTQGKSAQVKK
ncbi:MAG: hypothetical protein N2Z70_02110 [Bdellovibrionaceae bacterium]|jgi:hypothetical protein|nr:hypothetical protein [Pseudobdellovibrionaceae bacterium]